jgi:lysophospholipase L1-like esterase
VVVTATEMKLMQQRCPRTSSGMRRRFGLFLRGQRSSRSRPQRFGMTGEKRSLLLCLVILFTMTDVGAQEKAPIRYVAVGDSYSIGEGASPNESWPALLTRHLNEKGLRIELIANPSVTGWTTQQAIDRELPIFLKEKPNFGTLLIGVNDWVQGVNPETYRKNFAFLVDQMLAVLPDKKRLLIVTIPDFGVTPTGPKYARGRNISEGIALFNKIVTEESGKRSLRVVDIFELSKKMGSDSSLVAADGLHPSAKEYVEWEKVILPAVMELLGN